MIRAWSATSTSLRISRPKRSGNRARERWRDPRSETVVPVSMTVPIYRFGTEVPHDPSADRAQRRGRCASEALAQARTRPRLEQDDPARRLRMDQREPGPVERERIVGFQEMIVRVPILGNQQRSADAFDACSPGAVETDDLARIEPELGAVKADIHGRLLSRVTYCATPLPKDPFSFRVKALLT